MININPPSPFSTPPPRPQQNTNRPLPTNIAKPNGVAKSQDKSIFGGKDEISRIDLRQKLRKDSSVWMAERAVGLTLNPTERANLEKEVFSSSLGKNISKTDLNWGIKKLNQKLLGTKDPNEHAKIRKEIQFFKKIGGIK